MSLTIDVALTTGRLPLSRAQTIHAAQATLRAERVSRATLSIAFVSNARIARLNRRHLGRAGVTDVIAFGFPPAAPGAPLVGDIYIAPGVARRSAGERGLSVREELARLVIHGTLHVIGWDHPEGESRVRSPMWRRQERLVAHVLASGAR